MEELRWTKGRPVLSWIRAPLAARLIFFDISYCVQLDESDAEDNASAKAGKRDVNDDAGIASVEH